MRQMWKKKLEYFWMYNKISFLAALFVLAAAGYFLYTKAAEKEYALNAMLLDVHTDVTEDTLEEEFAAYAGIDTKKYDVLIATSLLLADGTSNYAMACQSRFYGLVGAEELDVGMMLEENFASFAGADAFLDLGEVFTEEELAAFPELYRDSGGRVLGVYGEELAKIREIGGYGDPDTRSVAGIIYNSRHVEAAKQFLLYLSEGRRRTE